MGKMTEAKSAERKPFKPTDPRPDFVAMEKERLDWWYRSGVVKKYLCRNASSKKRYSFLDGPITANNPMGVHHAWGRTLKDLYQRYHNMRGEAQRFQNGFDNQGLWVEVEVEKKKGFKDKKEIEKYGIGRFVEDCKAHTLHFSEVQTDQSKRLGYFMDWDNSYYTMSDENNYMIWAFLKKCWQTDFRGKPALYKGRDSVPWCPRCGTAISQHEILTEEYRELTHDSIFFELPVVGRENERFLVWTTTPWTLPANVALAVHPDLDYSLVVGQTGIRFWLVSPLAGKIFGQGVKRVKTLKGRDLVGWRYTGPFDHLPAVQKAAREKPETFHTVVPSEEYVNAEEGTGIVHLATGGGAEDFALGKKTDLPVIAAIDEAANYLPGFGDLSGKNAKDHPDVILRHPALKKKIGDPAGDYIFEIKPYTHRYPVCWRCKTELVWRVVDEWYIAMDAYREKIKKVAGEIRWIPQWGLKMELDWLGNMQDWLISKKRYWGLALPIWECACGYFEVVGGRGELGEKAVEGWEKFKKHSPHRPWIDGVKIKCRECGGLMSRIPDVGNPWLDAGIVSFSTLTEPKTGKVSYLTDKKYWREWFPADFVTECYPGQFKNWFYSLLAMATVLEEKPPFKTLLGHALVRDEAGEEMHKSKGNAVDFDEAAEKIGVDVMRWLFCCQNPEFNLNFGFHVGDEVRRRFTLLLWNVYHYFVTYANLDGFQTPGLGGKQSGNVLDRWVLVRLKETVLKVGEALDEYRHQLAAQEIEGFVQDLSTWWLRRSRERMGPSALNGKDKQEAYSTFFTVLTTLSRTLAPFVPFLAEEIYRNLHRDQKTKSGALSVHLADWPEAHPLTGEEKKLLEEMKMARKLVEIGHSLRKEKGLKTRQPLKSFWHKEPEGGITRAKIIRLVGEELNVKKVVSKDQSGKFVKEAGVVSKEADGHAVFLDTRSDPELAAEGAARELARQIQDLRKKEGLALDAKIVVYLPELPESVELRNYLMQKTLAVKLVKRARLAIGKPDGGR